MIVYRKSNQLRIRRASAPQAPFWCATAVAPYSARRGSPISIDYLDLRVTSAERLEVTVCDRTTDELERTRGIAPPLLVEATEFAEAIFRRGEEVLAFCERENLPALHLVSTRGTLPERDHAGVTTIIAAWPLDFERLEAMFASAPKPWGVVVPVIFPVTTELVALGELADSAKRYGASCFAAMPVEIDATAKQAIAQSLSLDGDHETYTRLFHSDLEPLHIATERHIAALAASLGIADFVVPPRFEEQTNWNASLLLTLTASRMLAMEHEPDLAAALARSARVVAELDKPLTRIAEAANLSIVEALDAVSVDVLSDWLARGSSPFVERVNARWRLRRDVGR